jgi:hypothetical protein
MLGGGSVEFDKKLSRVASCAQPHTVWMQRRRDAAGLAMGGGSPLVRGGRQLWARGGNSVKGDRDWRRGWDGEER